MLCTIYKIKFAIYKTMYHKKQMTKKTKKTATNE